MEQIIVSAPGKVILHGEHSVVYGKPAVAASLNLRAYLKIHRTDDGILTIDLPDTKRKCSWRVKDAFNTLPLPVCDIYNPEPASEEVLLKLQNISGAIAAQIESRELAIVAFLYLYIGIAGHCENLPSFSIILMSKLPLGAGLGSSASYSVCLASGLLRILGLVQKAQPKQNGESQCGVWSTKDLNLINNWAFISEKIIHGNPSGLDNCVSSFGGALKFQSKKMTHLQKMSKLRILLVNTNISRSTKTLVAKFGHNLEKYPSILQPVLTSMGAIAEQFLEILTSLYDENDDIDHYQTMEDLIDINHQHLAAMGVSHPALEDIVRTVRKHGMHAKLTGAGGGGCAYCLIRPDMNQEMISGVTKELDALGYQSWETTVGGNGVTEHLSYSVNIPFPFNSL